MELPKPAASLSAGLLARKGQARPALRPGLIIPDGTRVVEPTHHADRIVVGDAPATPVRSVELRPVEAKPQEAKSADAKVPEAKPVSSAVASPADIAPVVAGGRKAAFTLRLDSDRHLRLRLLCAHSRKSAQNLLIAALDTYLATNPIALPRNECPCREVGQ